ncbi:hypothetical protein BDR05DRAFT_995067 [Suillus weaverae]|nr:hypothetical protein BDR05DRAFT_995067 [Suillus weaverae]
MTSTTTPSNASGNPVAASSSAPLGSASTNPSATPIIAGPLMTHTQVVAENNCHTADNMALQLHRDAGELNIPADEPLLPIPPAPTTANSLRQWILAFIHLSPNLQAQGATVLDSIVGTKAPGIRPSVASVSKVLFDSSKEIATSSGLDSSYNFRIHHFIQDLANTSEYCPLTLFSNKNTEHLHCEGHSLKCTKVHVNRVSHHLLDLSQFKSERDSDPLTWQEAFQHYLM